MKDILDLFGRIGLAAIFLWEAYDSVAYFESTKEIMTTYGITWRQDLLLIGSIIFLILGGMMLLLGYRSGLGAFLLLLYWLPATLIIHSFWNDPAPEQREQAIQLMKNLAIAGGLLLVMVNGSGRYSVRRLFATFKVRGA